jgi:hypothetical protein
VQRALEGIVSKHALAPCRNGRSKTGLITESTFVVVGTDRDRKTRGRSLRITTALASNMRGAALIALAGEERAQFLGELQRLSTSWAALKSSRDSGESPEACGRGEASSGKQDASPCHGEKLRSIGKVRQRGAAYAPML